jgi:hypothetical protein
MPVQTAELYNGTVTHPATVTIASIANCRECGFGLNIAINVGAGNLVGVLSLESENVEGGNVGWTPEPAADAEFTQPDGTDQGNTPANFEGTKKNKYRVRLTTVSGSSTVITEIGQ